MRSNLAVLVLALVPCTSRAQSPSAAGSDQVRVAQGLLQGTVSAKLGVRAFLGVPYAAPPKRWSAPEPPASWQGVRSAAKFGDRCIQTHPFPDMLFQSAAESEDCLTLSIWTPARSGDHLPVMFWIHGGGFFSGASDEQRHDGSAFASKGVVLVTINYRLGIFGFFAHPALTAESPQHASGNYGMMDMIAALRWVRENIAAFGGDPNNVTIFGESAGSFAVSELMASPLARGLFHKAIGESGGAFRQGGISVTTLAAAERRGSDFAIATGAKSLADLRALSPAQLVQAVGNGPGFSPIVDGYVLSVDPLEVFTAGRQAKVPLMAGWNSAEIKLPPTTVAALGQQLATAFPQDLDSARLFYPAHDDREARLSAIALASDGFTVFGTWKWLELQSATGGVPVYRYLFDQPMPTETGPAPGDDPGAAHAMDIEYEFETLGSRHLAWGDVDRQVADLTATLWTNFAKHGDPNGPGVPAWPRWDAPGQKQLMRINAKAAAEPERDRARFLFLERVERARRSSGR